MPDHTHADAERHSDTEPYADAAAEQHADPYSHPHALGSRLGDEHEDRHTGAAESHAHEFADGDSAQRDGDTAADEYGNAAPSDADSHADALGFNGPRGSTRSG